MILCTGWKVQQPALSSPRPVSTRPVSNPPCQLYLHLPSVLLALVVGTSGSATHAASGSNVGEWQASLPLTEQYGPNSGGKYPKTGPGWQSLEHENLYYAGTNMYGATD